MARTFFKLIFCWSSQFIMLFELLLYRKVVQLYTYIHSSSVQFSRSVMSDSVTPWTAALQASLSITNSRSLLKLLFIESMMPSNHFILCHPLLLLPSIFPSIRVFSNEAALPIKWPKYWSFSFSISPSSEYSGLISFRIDLGVMAYLGDDPRNHKRKDESGEGGRPSKPALTGIVGS